MNHHRPTWELRSTATITRTTRRRRAKPPNFPLTEHRCRPPRTPPSTTERRRQRGADGCRRELPDPAAEPPKRLLDHPEIPGPPPQRPAPPEDSAVQGHRATPAGVPTEQEDKAPIDPAARGEEGPAAAVCYENVVRTHSAPVNGCKKTTCDLWACTHNFTCD
jgi:hypothetical protein